MRPRPRRLWLVLAAVAAAASFLTGMAATGAAARGLSGGAERVYVLENGVTAPVYDYGAAIRESVWVEVPDFAGCGGPLLVAADIIRPRELDGRAKVPVIMVASPYYLACGRGNESEFKEYDADGNPIKFPLFYDNYFVPRGYAVVAVDMAGTARSTGCSDEGAASDILSVKAVVDWLNGRGLAFDSEKQQVQAAWSDGTVGMIGKSYDGTLANGVAAMGVEGLKTIVPISAISSWYDYNRYQNLPFSYDYPSELSEFVASNRTEEVGCNLCFDIMDAEDGDETGAYTAFWAARDYVEGLTTDVSQVKASVFLVHGLQDDNVKTTNFARWWQALGAQHVERKLWLTRVGHVDPFDVDREFWVRTLHRWFDYQLFGIENGIDREPAVRVEVAPYQWVKARDWPLRGHKACFTPQANGDLVFGPGGKRDWPFRRHKARFSPWANGDLFLGPGGKHSLSWVNDPIQTETAAVSAGDNPNRLLFTTGLLTRALHISGAPQFELEVTHYAASGTGQVGVELVDYGDAERVLSDDDGVVTAETQSCWGESTATDDACYYDVVRNIGQTPLQVLSRGWARLDNPGTHRLTIDMIPNDVIVPAGHQLGLVVVSASPDWVVTVDPAPTAYILNLRASLLRLPIVGHVAAFRKGAARLPRQMELPIGTMRNRHTATRIPD